MMIRVCVEKKTVRWNFLVDIFWCWNYWWWLGGYLSTLHTPENYLRLSAIQYNFSSIIFERWYPEYVGLVLLMIVIIIILHSIIIIIKGISIQSTRSLFAEMSSVPSCVHCSFYTTTRQKVGWCNKFLNDDDTEVNKVMGSRDRSSKGKNVSFLCRNYILTHKKGIIDYKRYGAIFN